MMADHQSVTRMLKTARGQIDGILRMVEEDRYCVDISTQLMATQALLARINADVLKAHIEGCVTSAIESGDEDLKAAKLAEIERVVDKLSKYLGHWGQVRLHRLGIPGTGMFAPHWCRLTCPPCSKSGIKACSISNERQFA